MSSAASSLAPDLASAGSYGIRPSLPASWRALALLLAGLVSSGLLAWRSPAVVASSSDVYRSGGRTFGIDVYRTPGEGKPALLVIHGGSWKSGSRKDWQTFAPTLAAAGYVAFSVDYRLAVPGGTGTFPGALDDVTAAYGWIQSHGRRYGADPSRVGIVGSSAGGQLALTLASRLSGTPGAPAGVVALSPPAELIDLAENGPLAPQVVDYLGCEPAACPDRYRSASPALGLDERMAPAFVSYSTRELIPLRQERALRSELRRAGDVFAVRSGTKHALQMAKDVLPDAVAFLDRYLRP